MKKLLSLIAVCLCLWACAPQVTPADHETAQYLATKNIIKNWDSTPGKYQWNEKITRVEVVDMALAMADVKKNKTCRWDFIDIPKTEEDVCRTMESAADHDIISAQKDVPREKKKARPHDEIIRAEGLAILMKTCEDDGAWAGYSYYYSANLPWDGHDSGYKDIYYYGAEWQAQVFYEYVRKILHDDAQLHVNPWATVKATRKDVLEFAKNIMKYKEKQIQQN